jgi:leader peptidase (prepilin peptidase) / N-methyltransferase
MIVLMMIAGLLTGCLVNQASNFLPRFSSMPQAALPLAPAFWRVRSSQRENWFWLHLGVELASALVFAGLWERLGLSWALVIATVGYVFFLLIAVIDLKYRLVPNILTYPGTLAILAVQLLVLRQNSLNILLGGGLAFSIFFLTAWLKPGDLGMGDVKLAALIGFAFGFPQVLWALLVGAGTGALVAVSLLMARRGGLNPFGMKSHIPYAPFLCLGAAALLLYHVLVLA